MQMLPNPFDLRHHRSGPDGDLVERFLATYGNRQTRRNYRTDLRQFFGEEDLTSQKASRIREEDIIEFLEARSDSSKRTTLTRKTEALRSLFGWLVDQGVIDEPPIGESTGTGDFVDRILEEGAGATEEDEFSERVPDELPLVDGDSGGTGPGKIPDSGKDGSPFGDAEAGSSEEDTTGKDTVGEDPAREDSAGDPVANEKRAGDRPPEEISVDETPSDEESPGEEDPSRIPQWAFPSVNSTDTDLPDIDLERGENIPLEDLPDALCGGLRKLEEAGGPEGLFLRCTDDLAIRIRYRRDQESPRAEVRIKHRPLKNLVERRRDLSEEPALRQAILHLVGQNWTLPQAVYDLVDVLSDSTDEAGPFSEEHPRWVQENADDPMIRTALAGVVADALVRGFGLGRNEEVFLCE